MMGEYDAGYEHYIDSLIREIEKLQDENDKLCEQVSSLVGRSFRTADKMSCIEADNAKLRELCAGLLTGYECGYGELCKGCTWDGIGESKAFSCLPRAKARELGVEVNG